MAKYVAQQSNFTRGELDPRLIARTDTDLYRKGCKRIRNALVTPQGGIKRRPGLRWVDTRANTDEILLAGFEFSSSVGYLLVFLHNQILIYHNDVQVADVTTTWPGSVVSQLRFTQSADTMFICHPNYPPRQLVRTVAHSGWSLTNVAFRNKPVFDFLKNYDGIVFTPSTISGVVQLTASAPIFSTQYLQGIFAGNQGTLRLTVYVSPTRMDGSTVSDFANINPIAGFNAFLAEPVWSAPRGYPKAVTLYEDRLWFGGSKSLPRTLWASQVGDYTDFDFGTGLDSDAIGVTINSSKSNNIEYLVSSRTLAIFTDGAEFTAPQSDDRPLTPKTISVRLQSENGTSAVLPKIIDNTILYVQSGGKKVRSFSFDLQQQAYGSDDVSILAAHLIKNPVDSAVLKNSPTEDAEYYYLVNGDGSLVAFQTIKAQEVAAWSESLTDGNFIRIASVNADIYTAVRRVVNNVTVVNIEKLDASYYLDSATKQSFVSPTATVSGLGFLEGRTVKVRADGYVFQDRTVTGGQITLEQEATEVEVGLGYQLAIELMPPSLPPNGQIDPYTQKKISRFFIDYYQSLGIKVNDVLVPFLEFGNQVLDQAPLPKTGFAEMLIDTQFNPRETIIITQDDPLPFFLLGVAMEIT